MLSPEHTRRTIPKLPASPRKSSLLRRKVKKTKMNIPNRYVMVLRNFGARVTNAINLFLLAHGF